MKKINFILRIFMLLLVFIYLGSIFFYTYALIVPNSEEYKRRMEEAKEIGHSLGIYTSDELKELGIEPKKEQYVYITFDNAKYHKAGCDYMKDRPRKVSLSWAKSNGYGPCKSCFPEPEEENYGWIPITLITVAFVAILLGIGFRKYYRNSRRKKNMKKVNFILKIFIILLIFVSAFYTYTYALIDPNSEEYKRRMEEAEKIRQSAGFYTSDELKELGIEPKKEQYVYITFDNAKYHKAGCDYMKGRPRKVSLSWAKSNGYGPCKSCFPEPEEKNYGWIPITLITVAFVAILLGIGFKKYYRNKEKKID